MARPSSGTLASRKAGLMKAERASSRDPRLPLACPSSDQLEGAPPGLSALEGPTGGEVAGRGLWLR